MFASLNYDTQMAQNTTKVRDFETGEEKTLNSGFSQVYHNWWPIQRALIEEYPTALRVFSWLIEVADKRNAVLASYSAMSTSIGLNARTIMRAISYLSEKQIVTVLKSGNMNVYVINDRIIWKDTADRKDKFSQFSAEVFILASEQEEPYRSQLIGHAVPKPRRKPRNDRSKAIAKQVDELSEKLKKKP